MRLEKVSTGTLHVIEGAGSRTIRFESFSDDPMMQFLASLTESREEPGEYEVRRYKNATITLVIEGEDADDPVRV